MNPMLIERRKFDLRVFALFTAHAESKMMRGYFYSEGYLRTSCKEYDLTKVDNRLIHLMMLFRNIALTTANTSLAISSHTQNSKKLLLKKKAPLFTRKSCLKLSQW